jgi:hypothetical protein
LTGYNRVSILALVAVAGLALSACAHRSKDPAAQSLQGGMLPDEFRVISHRPLVVPPEYGLRPPVPGKPRPQELQPETAARTALLGQAFDPNASQGERLLLSKAGVDANNNNMRQVVDDEFGDVTYKSKSFADKVMFWKKGDTTVITPAAGSVTPSPIDPAAEQKRIDSLTAGKDITIVREAPTPEKRKIKLPGL